MRTLRILGALIAANARQTARDRMSLFWFLAFPVIFILLFGAIFSEGGAGDQSFSVGIVAEKKSTISFLLNRTVNSVPAFRLSTGSRATELAALRKGERNLVLIVPSDAKALWDAGAPIELPTYYDASRQQTAQVLLSSMSQIVGGVERQLTGDSQRLSTAPQPIQPKRLKDIDYLLPGILAMTLMQLGLFGAMNVVSLREQKVLKGLGVTPMPRWAFLFSEIVVRMLLSLIQTVVLVAVGVAVYDIHLSPDWLPILGVVLLGALTFVSMGYSLACLARTVDSGQGLVQAVQFPMMFLSGIFFPIDMMPKVLEPVIRVIPLTYLGDAMRQVMVGSVGAYSMTTDLVVLGAWTVGCAALASRFWRWE